MTSNEKIDLLKSYIERQDKREQWIQKNCDSCEQVINGELEWAKHVETKKHNHNQKQKLKAASGLSDKEYYQALNKPKMQKIGSEMNSLA